MASVTLDQLHVRSTDQPLPRHVRAIEPQRDGDTPRPDVASSEPLATLPALDGAVIRVTFQVARKR